MIEKQVIMLDARTRNARTRITSFGSNLEDMMKDYMDWVEEHGFSKDDIWYADIFDIRLGEHIYKLVMDDGSIYAEVAADRDLSPLKRRRTLKQVLASKIKDMSDRLNEAAWEEA